MQRITGRNQASHWQAGPRQPNGLFRLTQIVEVKPNRPDASIRETKTS